MLKDVTDFSNTLMSNLSGFGFWIFFCLINILFIFYSALTILWSLPVSALVKTSLRSFYLKTF